MSEKILKYQLILFLIAYSVWMLPHTNFLWDLCSILGAMISLYVIYSQREYLYRKEIIPIFIVIILFIWVVFHSFFFSKNYLLQINELSGIWKRVFIATLFGFGLGINFSYKKNVGYGIKFFTIVLTIPVFIYYFKILMGLIAISLNFQTPEYFKIYDNRISTHYIAKPEYLFFIYPALLFALINIYKEIIYGTNHIKFILLNFVVIFLVYSIFYFQKMKSGFFFGFVALIIFTIFIVKSTILDYIKGKSFSEITHLKIFNKLLILVLFLTTLTINITHFSKDNTWRYLLSDIKIGLAIDDFEHWKVENRQDNPLNSYNIPVSKTTYDRVAWAVSGLQLLNENPLGYGLLEYSFHYLAKEKWPSAMVPQTHNSWIDFGLAFGLPGIILLLSSFLYLIFNYYFSKKFGSLESINAYVSAILISYMGILIVSEVNFKYALSITFFWIAFFSGVQSQLSCHKYGCIK